MAARNSQNPAPGRYPRAARVNEVLRQVLAEQIERLADSDERLRMVTVTGVEVTPDLKSATVYLSKAGGSVGESLAEHRIELQSGIAKQVHMKRTPKLSFVVDPALVEGEKIEQILRRIRNGEDPRSGGGRVG